MFGLIKQVLKDSVSHERLGKLRCLAYRLAYPPPLYSKIAGKLVLILGCQRSGNTLTYLMLNAHPAVHGIDESDVGYQFPKRASLNVTRDGETLIALKFPTQTARIDYVVDYLSSSKIIWPSRNPYAVVSSMLRWKENKGNWIAVYAREELWQHSFLFSEITDLDLEGLDDVSLGAYVWKYKERALQLCKESKVEVFSFRYESLLENPRQFMSQIIDFIGLEWDESVLNYQEKYSPSKRYPGGTDGSKALDKSRKNPELCLTERDIEIISRVCAEEMAAYGYQAPSETVTR
jgi:hypothetical protein